VVKCSRIKPLFLQNLLDGKKYYPTSLNFDRSDRFNSQQPAASSQQQLSNRLLDF
jgi:hypothetical protein